MRANFRFDNHENINNLLIARRLAQFCPSSLSVDDFYSSPSKSSSLSLNLNTSSTDNIMENFSNTDYIKPSPLVKIETLSSNITEPTSAFKCNVQHTKHRFGFLLADIKPIENKINYSNSCKNMLHKASKKMRYELPNVKKIDTPIKNSKPLMIISFSSANLNNKENYNTSTNLIKRHVDEKQKNNSS